MGSDGDIMGYVYNYIYIANNIGDLMRCDGDIVTIVGYLANNHELGLTENGAYNKKYSKTRMLFFNEKVLMN